LKILSLSINPMDMQLNQVILEAIALKKCVTVTYNRAPVTLAPHILYTRHNEPHVDAVTVDRGGQQPREIKLGTFKLSGLSDAALAPHKFIFFDGFDQKADRYDGVTLFVVE
jgi:hypothetical protein